MIVTLDHSTPESADIRTFWFKPERVGHHTAGQFIEIVLPHDADDRGQKRWFTLSSSPTEPLLSITTKLSPDSSSFKKTLFSLQPGTQIQMSDPMGDFVLPKDVIRPLVFIAGGIGITPIRSMIKWLYDTQGYRTMQLLYAAKDIDHAIFRPLFNDYGAPTTLILEEPPRGWDGDTGHLSAAKILEISPDVDNKLYYISGPEPMIETLFADLQTAGVPADHLVTDYFPGYTSI